MGALSSLQEFRHSNAFAVIVFFFPLFLSVWQYDVVTRGCVEWVEGFLPSTAPEYQSVVWWVGNLYMIIAAVLSPIFGIWVNFFSTKKLLIFMNLFAAIFCLVYSLSINVTTVIIAQTVLGVWAASALVCSHAYFARISSIANRTRFMIGLYFVLLSLSPAIINAFREALGHCPAAPLGGYLLCALLVVSTVLLLFFPEQPVSLTLGELYVEGRARTTMRNAARRCVTCSDVMSVPAVLACLFLIISTMFGFGVYRYRVSDTIVNNLNFPINAQRAFVYGILGAVVVTSLLLWLVIRWVSDRKLLMVVAFTMIVGYLLVIKWAGVESAPRFVIGAVIITLSDGVVMAIGASLFSKIITPAFQGLWMGAVIGLQFMAQVLAVLWYSPDSDAPYEVTLGIIGFALLLQLPIYRFLLPQVYSPWSGAGLPVKNTHGDEVDAHSGKDTLSYVSRATQLSSVDVRSPGAVAVYVSDTSNPVSYGTDNSSVPTPASSKHQSLKSDDYHSLD